MSLLLDLVYLLLLVGATLGQEDPFAEFDTDETVLVEQDDYDVIEVRDVAFSEFPFAMVVTCHILIGHNRYTTLVTLIVNKLSLHLLRICTHISRITISLVPPGFSSRYLYLFYSSVLPPLPCFSRR